MRRRTPSACSALTSAAASSHLSLVASLHGENPRPGSRQLLNAIREPGGRLGQLFHDGWSPHDHVDRLSVFFDDRFGTLLRRIERDQTPATQRWHRALLRCLEDGSFERALSRLVTNRHGIAEHLLFRVSRQR